MEVLGEPREKTVDFFRCIEKPSTRVEGASGLTLTDVRSSLLSASSHFGYLCVAKGDHVLVFELKALRDENSDPTPIASVSFGEHNVGAILSIAFLLSDTALAVYARPVKAGTPVLILASFTALVNGFVSSLPCPAVADDLENVTVRLQHHDDAQSTSQCIATLSTSGAVHLHWVSFTASEVESVRVDEDGLGSDGVLSLALSPSDELLAVGTKRGSVCLYATDGVSLRTTIGAVESGWMPFSVHFASSDAVFVSYACEDRVLHVMWTIAEENGELVARDPSSLGELCFPSLSLPLSSDGEEPDAGGEGTGEQQPVISICPIPGWDVCVVTSSLSTDMEIISCDDDGRWEKWNLDEGKSATLPVDGNDVDTQPLGIALDLTDTSSIDSADPSTPRVNSMPRLIAFTTDSLLLPFQLIDDRPGAKCEYVKSPGPLPPVPVASVREEQIPVLDMASDVRDTTPRVAMMSSAGFAAVSTSQPPPAATMGAGQAPSFAAIAKGEADSVFKSPFITSASMPAFGATRHDSGTLPSITSSFAHVRGRTESTSSDDSESSESLSSEEDTSSGSDREPTPEVLETGLASLPSGFDRLMGGPGVAPFASAPVSSNAFTDTEKFLSKFQFSPAPKKKEHVGGDRTLSSGSTGSLFEAPQTGITAISNPESVVSRIPKPLPSFPPQPTYEGAAAAVSTGKPLDLIRSMLLEMQEEIKYHSDAHKVCDERLRMTGIGMSTDIEAVSTDVVDIQDSMEGHFREEATLRKQVLDSLKEILALSCKFESLSLEFRIREEEGFTSRIRAEEAAADEKLTKKEAEILKSIASIEGRLNAHVALKGAKGNQTEQIQQIYSSLSLQSIRVRRIQSLLVALAERVRDVSRDGRRSDLGLSMARLEKLSIAHNQSPRTGVNGSLERADTFGGTRKAAEDAEYSQQNGTSSIAFEDSSLISGDVRRVLQRLAMRSGRANICVKRVRPRLLKACPERRREDVSAEAGRNDINKKRLLNGEDASPASSNGAAGKDCGRSISYETSPFLPAEMQRAASTDNRNGRSFAEIRSNGAKKEQPVGRQVAPANHGAEVSKGGLFGSIGNAAWGSGSGEGAAGGSGVFGNKTTAINSSPAAPERISTRKSGPATSPPRSSDGNRQTPAAGESLIAFTKQSRTPFGTQPPASATKPQQADVAERARASLAEHSSAARPERETGGDSSNLSAAESSGSDVASKISSTPPSFALRPPDSSVSAAPSAPSVAERATPASNKGGGSLASVKMGPPTVSKEGSEVKISEVSDALQGSLNMFGTKESTATDATESLMGAEVTIDATALPTWQSKASETLFGGSQFTNPVSSSPVFGAAFGAARPAESAGTEASGSGSSTDSDSDGRPVETTGAGMEMTGSVGGGTSGTGQGTVGGGSLFGSFQSSTQPSQAWGTSGGWGNSGSSMFGSGTSAAAPHGAAVMQDPPAAGAFSSGGQDKAPLSFGGMGGASSGGFAGAGTAAFGAPSPLGGTAQPAAFSLAASAPGFGASAQFGMASSLGAAPSFGAPSQIGGGAAFGQPSGWGTQFNSASQTGGAQFGGMSQTGTGFGGAGGGGPSPFAAAQGSAGTAGFGAGGGGFGAGGGSAMDQSNAGGGGFGSASPFSSMGGTGFGGQSGGGSGFASLAGSGGFGGGQPSGFGNGAPPVFGSNQGPPAFKSAAFSQRRG